MRPERLELEGFTAFRSPVTVEFGDCDLFAFVGPTGSGKSSLIDAIVFALYGSIPRYDDRRLVAPAISQGLVQARVRLDFAVGAERYTAVRVVRAGKDGRASTREARLERRLADGGVEVLAGEADEVTRGVEALLGLSYEHFTTCVVLPQGEFARFLHHKPRDRQALLIRLLELGLYERMGQLARARAAAAAGGREAVGRRLAELAPVTEEERAALAARVQSLDSLLEQVDKAKPELDALAAELDAAAAAAAAAERDAALLAGVAPPEDLPGLAAELAAADAELAAAAAELEGAEVALGAAEAEVEAPGAARLAPEDAARLLGARTEAAQQAKLASKGEAAAAQAAAEHERRAAAAEAADELAAAARAHLEEARTHNRAAALAAALAPGDLCPVCGAEVGATLASPPDALAELERAEGAAALAAERADAARAAAQHAALERARVDEKLAGVRGRLAALAEAVADAPSAEELADLLAAGRRAAAEAKAARTALQQARRRLAAAERVRRGLAEREQAAQREYDDARERVGRLGPPPRGDHGLAARWAALAAWASEAAAGARAAHASAADAADAARRRAAARFASIERALAAAGLAPGGLPFRDVVVDARSAAAAELARVEGDLALAERLRREEAELAGAERVAAALGRHLGSNAFQKWVLDEALGRLVSAATALLFELSGGAYSLTLEPRSSNFAVVDHVNGDARRSARTLSGGETFLASLALALALADQVVELAAGPSVRLESIFLDEGFGALDPETLDAVAAAIEELGARGRVVGLVSHVRELAERLPVRFEVRKLGGASTVTRVG